MFFHIPIPEYNYVEEYLGEKQEGVYDANVNSGLFSAILEGFLLSLVGSLLKEKEKEKEKEKKNKK